MRSKAQSDEDRHKCVRGALPSAGVKVHYLQEEHGCESIVIKHGLIRESEKNILRKNIS